MGSLTDFSENKLLDHVLNTAYTPAATIYLALATADPTDTATGASANEVANSGSYARTAITFGSAASRRITQNATVTFPQASGSWGTVSHWFIVDTATYGSGNVLAHGSFVASKAIVSGNTPSIASGETYIEFSAGEISDYLSNKLLDLMFKNVAYSRPSTYIALTTATISDSNTGSTITEPSGGSYARKLVNANGGSSPTWNLASAGIVTNNQQIDMATATASWGTITSIAIVDASSAGNSLFYDNGMTCLLYTSPSPRD
jgi:hypothetical protein